MAYKLKSTGIAAYCTMCIAVDPDTMQIKDFASDAVTADMTVGENVVTGTQEWNGQTRAYFRLGSGNDAADFVAFGNTKPNWPGNTNGARTWVCVSELADASSRVFGSNSSHYAASRSLASGGSTHPCQAGLGVNTGSANGGQSVASGQKRIYGMSQVHGTGGYIKAFTALHDAEAMTVSDAGAAPTSTASAGNVSLAYVGRRNDATAHTQCKYHLVAFFSTDLQESDWDALREDWFGTLFEPSDAGDPPLGTVTIEDVTPAATSATVTYSYDDTDATGFEYRLDGGAPVALDPSPAVITGLTPETEYDLEVRAVNEDGAGAWSSVATFETLADVPDTPPGVISLSAKPFKNIAREVIAGKTFNYWVYDADRQLVATGVGNTDASGYAGDIEAVGIEPETVYFVDWLFEDGEYGCARIESEPEAE
jgi:hypothetical protein